MSALTRPRGPLPSRVYWFRRALVVVVLVALVLVATRLVGGDDDAPQDAAPTRTAARQAAAEPSPSAKRSAGSAEPSGEAAPSPSATPAKPRPKPSKRPLPQPDGPCDPADVLVTPAIGEARRGEPVDITLSLTTIESAACTFEVSPEALFVTVSSDTRTLWASQHCSSVVPTEEVVPRRTKAAEVVLEWDGRESTVDCPMSDRVGAGEYTVAAMTRGSVNVEKSTFRVTSG